MALRGILPVVILWSSLIGLVLAQNPSNGTNGTVYSNVNETVSPVVASPASIVPSAAPTEATPMPTSAPFAVPPEQECYTNLTALNLIVRAKPAYEKKTYILCSNSVIQVGRLGPDGECCTGGVDPLWPRRDVTYQCGEDGSSANNCTLVGGAVHVLGFKYMFNNEPKTDAVFRGITFDAAYDISILMIAPGTYFFHDCIFKVCYS